MANIAVDSFRLSDIPFGEQVWVSSPDTFPLIRLHPYLGLDTKPQLSNVILSQIELESVSVPSTNKSLTSALVLVDHQSKMELPVFRSSASRLCNYGPQISRILLSPVEPRPRSAWLGYYQASHFGGMDSPHPLSFRSCISI